MVTDEYFVKIPRVHGRKYWQHSLLASLSSSEWLNQALSFRISSIFLRLGNSCLVFLGPSFRSTGDHQSALISPLHWHLKSHHWPGQWETLIMPHWPIRRLLHTGIKSLTWHLHNYPGNCFYQNFHPGISLPFGSLHAPTWCHHGPGRARKSLCWCLYYTRLIFSDICYSKLLSVQFIFFSSIRCQIYFPLEYKER